MHQAIMGGAMAVGGDDQNLSKLLAPTEDRPQINLPTKSQERQPLVQGECVFLGLPTGVLKLQHLIITIFNFYDRVGIF